MPFFQFYFWDFSTIFNISSIIIQIYIFYDFVIFLFFYLCQNRLAKLELFTKYFYIKLEERVVSFSLNLFCHSQCLVSFGHLNVCRPSFWINLDVLRGSGLNKGIKNIFFLIVFILIFIVRDHLLMFLLYKYLVKFRIGPRPCLTRSFLVESRQTSPWAFRSKIQSPTSVSFC